MVANGGGPLHPYDGVRFPCYRFPSSVEMSDIRAGLDGVLRDVELGAYLAGVRWFAALKGIHTCCFVIVLIDIRGLAQGPGKSCGKGETTGQHTSSCSARSVCVL